MAMAALLVRHARPALLAGLLLVLLLPAPAPAASASAPPKVYRDRIEPRWFADNTRFWYRNDGPDDTRDFVSVDVAAGTRRPAFDHARLADAFARLDGRTNAPQRLPIRSLAFSDDGKSIRLDGPDGAWNLDLATYDLAVARESGTDDVGLPSGAEPRPSVRTGPESAITFENRLEAAIELFWMSPENDRVPYGRLGPRETRRQHTFAGHVWIAVRSGAVVGVFEAEREPRRAVVDGRTTERRRGERSRGVARAEGPASVPSPDGVWEAFVRDHNLWLRQVSNRVEQALSHDGNPGHSFRRDVQRARLVGMEYEAAEPPATLPEVHWSPDSRFVLALQTRTIPERRVSLVESSPRDQLQPRLSSYPYLKAGDELPVQTPRLFEVAARRELLVDRSRFPNPWSLDEFRWAPDSSRFTFLYNQRGHQVLRLLAVAPPAPVPSSPGDPVSATLTTLVEESAATFVDYSNKTYLHFLDAARELIWMSERSGWNHLYLVDAHTGAVRHPITQGEWLVRGVDRIDAGLRQVWFRAVGIRPGQDPYHVHFARVNFDGTGLVLLTEGDGTHELQWSPDRRHYLDTWSRVDHPPVHELRRAEDGRRVCLLEEADAREVLQARGRFPERFTATARDGRTPVWGILHRPRNFDPARKYPVLENIYAGPHGHHVPKAFRPQYRSQEELADRGFVVVQIDGMGTNWRHKAFHDVAWRNLGDAGFPDRIAWLRAAAAVRPELDLKRVGIYGGSAGGQNALRALLAHGDFYRAAVADCGCHDNRLDKIWWNEAWMGWPVGPHYAEQSNVTQAHRLQGKLMLVVGELDKNVDPASTTQVVNALVKADKDFDFVLLPGVGHGAAESDYGRRRRADFLVRHLGDR